jgi:Protein of unknown function (DUF2971)
MMADSHNLPLYSASFAEHLRQPTPDFLYHYTSQDGLLGIIESGSLWATAISYLNDAMEFALPLGLIRDRLFDELQSREMQAAHFAKTDPARASRANQRKDRARVFSRFVTPLDTRSPLCVTCFCANGDLLSQWRGYAGDGYGFSLGFIPSILKAIASDSGFLLGKCIYDPDLQKKIIAEGVEYLMTTTPSGRLEEGTYFWTVMTYGAFFKHLAFEQEQEWRLVSPDPANSHFRRGKSMIIPYASLPINSVENLGLDHAFVGPSPHMALSTRSAEDMLLCNNIDVIVHPSSIPFRNW